MKQRSDSSSQAFWPMAFGILAGLAYFLAFAPNPHWWISIFLPFFLLLCIEKSKNLKQAFLSGWLTGIVSSLGGFYWVKHVAEEFGGLPPWLSSLVLFLFSLVGEFQFALYTSFAFLIKKKFKTLCLVKKALVFASLYTLLEMYFPKIFPDAVGYVFVEEHWILGSVDLFGLYLLSFLVFWIGNHLAYGVIALKRSLYEARPKVFLISAFISLLLFSLLSIYSLLRHEKIQKLQSQAESLEVLIVQANIGNIQKVAAEKGYWQAIGNISRTYFDMTSKALTESLNPATKASKPGLIVWPETAYPASLESDSKRQVLSRMINRWDVPLITGGYDVEKKPNEEIDYNAVFGFDETGEWVGTYRKVHLLAFGEYFPLSDTFPFLKDLIPTISDFGRGDGPRHLFVNDFKFSPVICYEILFPAYVREALKNSDVILNVTNDSWFGKKAQPFQHLLMSKVRSVELRKPLIRATNTGISALFDANGTFLAKSGFGKETISASMPIASDIPETLYSKTGDWPLATFLILAFLSIYVRQPE
jgi:apolipoprotein N-acyltransferase